MDAAHAGSGLGRVLAGLALSLGAAALGAQSPVLKVLDYSSGIPATWQARTPSSTMRLAEFVIPSANGGSAAEVVVYYFGTGQGGSVDANIGRWRSQFTNPDGGAVPERIVKETGAAFPITVAEWRGTYARGVGTGAASGDARPNHTLVAAIAETPRGTLFFQLFGPSASVALARNAYVEVVRGLR